MSVRRRPTSSRLDAAFLPAIAVLPFVLIPLLPDGVLGPLVGEDGVVEWSGAIAWLLAGTLFASALWSRRRSAALSGAGAFWLSGLALMCLLAAGEEISWGQRLLGYETPAVVARSNLQNEMNLHNLRALDTRLNTEGTKKTGLARWLTFGRISTLIWMGYLVAVPVLVRHSALGRTLIRRVALPAPPFAVALAGVASYAAFRAVLLLFDHGGADGQLINVSGNETKESVIAALFLYTAYFVHRHPDASFAGDRAPADRG